MTLDTDVLIIGAGPFGLSLAAYAAHRRLDHRLVGQAMEFWTSNMPTGMYLRSGLDWHLDPLGIDTIESFLKSENIASATAEPLSLELYLRYVRWFQERKSIEPLPVHVRRLDHAAGAEGFQAHGADGSAITARSVVIAVGFKYFKHLPAELAARVPPKRLSHTCDLIDFAPLRDKRCLIIGGRQSAFEWAALICEAGAGAVHVCHRHDSPAFTASDWSWVGPLVDMTRNDAGWFRKLSAAKQEELRRRLWAEGRLKVEPWLAPRIARDNVSVWPRCELARCVEEPDGALAATLDNGKTLIVDHVIAATGYKVDIARVPFLAAGNLLQQLAIRDGFPELDEHFQSNIPGLFITSMPATQDFGPFWGFTIAAPVTAEIIGRELPAAPLRRALAN
jgi:FAD-dependent urate hydroxylase